MKRLFICLFALFAAGTATAETMCVKLDASQDCTRNRTSSEYYNHPDWDVTCNGVPVSGIGYCSNQGATYSDKSDAITNSSDNIEDNKYCWCKMTSPAVSSWVFGSIHGSASDCARGCAYRCAVLATNSSDFRSALFSDLH